MFQWIMYWIWWGAWRTIVTCICAYTIQNVIHMEGYRVEWSTMMIAAISTIIGIRVWMPFCIYKHVDS